MKNSPSTELLLQVFLLFQNPFLSCSNGEKSALAIIYQFHFAFHNCNSSLLRCFSLFLRMKCLLPWKKRREKDAAHLKTLFHRHSSDGDNFFHSQNTKSSSASSWWNSLTEWKLLERRQRLQKTLNKWTIVLNYHIFTSLAPASPTHTSSWRWKTNNFIYQKFPSKTEGVKSAMKVYDAKFVRYLRYAS